MIEVPNYNIIKILGSGAFGYVFEVIDRRTGKKMALKRVEKAGSGMSRQNEMLLMLKGCPNIIQIQNLFYTENEQKKLIQNIVFQYLQTNLEKVIEKHSKKSQYLPQEKIKFYIYQMLNGLMHAHAKFVAHRDLKPENILLNQKDRLKICDFGCSKVIDRSGVNTPYVGTIYYRAPQLLMGISQYTTAIDIWSAGCILAELALLQVFFVGQNDGDQLFAILKIMGSLTSQEQRIYKQRVPFDVSMMEHFRGFKRINLQEKFSHITDKLFLDLLLKMLAYLPEHRCTAAQALKHPYFQKINFEAMIKQQ